MYKFVIISCILFGLTSCTLPWNKEESIPTEHTFINDYHRHIDAVSTRMEKWSSSYRDIAEVLRPSGRDNSQIRISGLVPGVGSGELSLRADARRKTRDLRTALELELSGWLQMIDSFIDIKKFKA